MIKSIYSRQMRDGAARLIKEQHLLITDLKRELRTWKDGGRSKQILRRIMDVDVLIKGILDYENREE